MQDHSFRLIVLSSLLFFATISLPFAGCSCSGGEDPPEDSCLSSDDCPSDQDCIDGVCSPATTGDTGDDADPLCPNANICEDMNAECGPIPDGCGGSIDCGDCPDDLLCGMGDDRGRCVDDIDLPECEPLGCEDFPDINCGPMPDACGGLTEDCGDCTSPEICGGGSEPSVCGAETTDDCTGELCEYQITCSGDQPHNATTLTGTVVSPNGDLPIPNATVYVPDTELDDLPPITSGPVCEQCEDKDLGDVLVATTTDHDGSFELRHIPADTEFPLVIRIGQWRRVVTVSPRDPCQSHQLSASKSSLPASHRQNNRHDHLPRVAISTGAADAMECVFYKLGVDPDEFTRHDEDGRFHIYRANGAVADPQLAQACDRADCSSPQSDDACHDRNPSSCGNHPQGRLLQDHLSHNLYGDADRLNSYDMVVMACEGWEHSDYRSDADKRRLLDYANAGGRIFASHFAYDWLHETDEFQDTAVWGGAWGGDQSLATVDTSFDTGLMFWNWLRLVGADHGGDRQIQIQDPRAYVQDIDDDLSERWIYTDASMPGHYEHDSIQQYTFDTPVHAPANNQCGQVAYSAFHVAEIVTGHGPAFPSYCDGALTPQEKVLAFMLFNLATCVDSGEGPPQPECHPRDCSDIGAECGMAADGCGGTIDCGDCPSPQVCGGDRSQPNQCALPCSPLSCDDHDAQCGEVDDGCGSTIDCGDCSRGRCIDLRCQCRGFGESCESNSECCSNQCVIGSDGDGVCIQG